MSEAGIMLNVVIAIYIVFGAVVATFYAILDSAWRKKGNPLRGVFRYFSITFFWFPFLCYVVGKVIIYVFIPPNYVGGKHED